MKIINLLPPARQQLFKQEAIFRTLLWLIGISVFSFILVIACQLGVKFYLQNQARAISQNIETLQNQVKKQENSTTIKQINDFNNFITDYKNLGQAIPKWSKVVKAFAALPPAGVSVNSFSADFTAKTIQISGQSPSRELVIQLYNNILNDDKEFYGIDYPLENVAQPANISYHFTFKVREELLK